MKWLNWLICALFGCDTRRIFFVFGGYQDECARCGKKGTIIIDIDWIKK